MKPPTFGDYADRVRGLARVAHRQDRGIDGTDLRKPGIGPILSVVTVTFNSAATLERTIASISAQTYSPIEYIIIDGGSTDGTLKVIEKFASRLAYWHSSKDHGISDAFNLGLSVASGKYVAFVNSDDWMSATQAELAVGALENSQASFAFGRLAFHTPDGSLRYCMDGDPRYWRNIRWRMPHINHATVVARRDAYATVGLFDLRRRIAMDYDWHLRAELRGLRGTYVPDMLGHMSEGGVCDKQWAIGLKEVREIAIAHGQGFLVPSVVFMIRTARAWTRIGLHKIAPASLVNRLHSLVNPRFKISSVHQGER
jgi:glycosyltransferase involved in cell wall biosynthesis